ncbi:hypothetical protein ACJIZ3_022461 [Penstemon smallii]|uniref:F-box domain-containing protein n=1 Tax=Penstemon smallii TaxID=265156 RepID=A0ABD3TMA4_9LAMI
MSSRIKIPRKTKQAKIRSKAKQPKPAEVVVSLDELLIQILLRLPAKSVMRFKLVSKHWKYLITSPHFALQHNRNPSPAVGLFYESSELVYIHLNARRPRTPAIPPIRELFFPGETDQYCIGQSCNGLLVCCSYGSNHNQLRGSTSVVGKCYIYNPTTKQFTTIPHLNKGKVRGINLAYDRAKSPPYKLVAVRDSEDSKLHKQIEIYSSESGEWRVSVHWMNDYYSDLWYFNVDQERLGVIRRLDRCKKGQVLYFGESCDHLHLIERYDNDSTLYVYEMKRDHSEWLFKHQVDISIVASKYHGITFDNDEPRNGYGFSVFSFVRGKEVEEDSFLILQAELKVIRFNLGRKTFKVIFDLEGTPVSHMSSFSGKLAFEYIESLACV